MILLRKRERELVALLLLCARCHVVVNVLCLLLTVPRVGLYNVFVALCGQTHLRFGYITTHADCCIISMLYNTVVYNCSNL